MIVEETNINHLIAGNGKVLRRISDKTIVGKEIHLGMAYYLGGALLEKPLLELPEHFEEINDPAEEATVLLDEEMPIEAVPEETVSLDEQTGRPPDEPIRRAVTMADYRELERKVELLMQIMKGTE